MTIASIALLDKVAGGTVDRQNAGSVLGALAAHGVKFGLDRDHRLAHYFAQLMHESGRFRYDQEVFNPNRPTPAQARYEDRKDLGHSAAIPGEAFKFRGRSGIQLTGRHNYQKFTRWVRANVDPNAPDFEQEPEKLNTDPWEGLAPIWFWSVGNQTGKSLNLYADNNNIEAITRKINGGLNGYEDRVALYTRVALAGLGFDFGRADITKFQRKAGFGGRDVDGIAGMKTRQALHDMLVAGAARKEAPAPEETAPVVDGGLLKVRALLAEADQLLVTLTTEEV